MKKNLDNINVSIIVQLACFFLINKQIERKKFNISLTYTTCTKDLRRYENVYDFKSKSNIVSS